MQLCQAAAGGATGSILAHHLCITYRILNEWNAVIACFNTYEGEILYHLICVITSDAK